MAPSSWIEVVGASVLRDAPVKKALEGAGFQLVDAAAPGGRPAGSAENPALVLATGDAPAEACRRVRDDPARAAVPLLAVLGPATANAAAACIAAGADDVLVEPAEIPVASARVRSLLRAAHTARPTPAPKPVSSEAPPASRLRARRSSPPQFDAERRLRSIDSLSEHFDAAGDGVFVVDETGCILFVSRAAEAMTGIASRDLVGAALPDIVPGAERAGVTDVIANVLSGENLEPFDMTLRTAAGSNITVSVTTSTVLRQTGAVVFSFRDVSARRALEAELRQTKDFLERLIDSTVDGIIAADLRGNVILFNAGAERIYGYRAEEVIGRVPVWELYPQGAARDVMQMLRSGEYGGAGRLEQTRWEVLGKQGEVVPVNMSASLIYEDDREIASVGVFSDLRERLRMEERLLVAQEQLERRESQAVVAGVAGAAAHELNQPLTSIMGYTSLIRRQSDAEAPHLRALDIIEEETERMAEIVKKIGRITRFETKAYVGGASILDLERSAAGTEGHGLTGAAADDVSAGDAGATREPEGAERGGDTGSDGAQNPGDVHRAGPDTRS